jgi:hypothetical protein
MKIFGFNFNKKEQPVIQQSNENYERFSLMRNTITGNGKINYDYNIPLITEVYNTQYIYFGDDNMYPNILNELYYSSPFHSSIINFKQLNLVGSGYEVISPNNLTEQQKIDINQMKFIFNENFINQMGMDFLIHGRLTWKITWNNEHTKIVNIERIEPANVRAYEKNEFGRIPKYAISTDWQNKLRYNRATNFVYIPAFDTFKKDEKVQLWTYQIFSPGLEYYCQPVYANAANWIYLDGQISFYHKSNIENSINPSMVLKFYEKPANQQEQQEFIYRLRRDMSGARNSGKVLTFFSNGKDLAPDVESIEANKLDEAFAVTQEMIIKNIAFSHTIDPVLMGISTPGALGQSQQLETAYKIFDNTFVLPNQQKLDKVLNLFFDINRIQGTIKLNHFNLL